MLDTHILVHWLSNSKELSKEQLRVIESGVRRGEQLGVCTVSLIEIGLLLKSGRSRLKATPKELLEILAHSIDFVFLPATIAIAEEFIALGPSLRDPADRTIVATARINGLKLVTSDQRIIDSKLVHTVE